MSDHKIEVKIVTTAGNFPEAGFRAYTADEKLSKVLEEAADHLKLQNTGSWIAKLDGRTLDPALSLAENHIPNKSKISWAPAEPGGGELCTQK